MKPGAMLHFAPRLRTLHFFFVFAHFLFFYFLHLIFVIYSIFGVLYCAL